MRNITEVICISKEPSADLQREGFQKALYLDSTIYTIDSDTEGDLLSIFGEICDAIDWSLADGDSVLVWDIGGGVAAMAAYSKYITFYALTRSTRHHIDTKVVTAMKRCKLSLPEALIVITQARLKRAKPTPLPSQRIVDLLHNDNFQNQLDLWEACNYNIYENTVVNPNEPREKWIVEKVGWDTGENKEREDDVPPILRRITQKLPLVSNHPHRLSTIAELEEEVRRLSIIREDNSEG